MLILVDFSEQSFTSSLDPFLDLD